MMMMKKGCFLVLAVGAVAIAPAQVLFSDGFESGNLSMWDASAPIGTVTVQNTEVRTGSFAATTAGAVGSRAFANLSRPEAADEIVTLNFWMKLAATNVGNRHYAELRSYENGTFGSGALNQLYAIGAYNAATVNGANTSKWQARIAFGAGVQGWYTLDQAADRTTDWTEFTLVLTPTTIQFYVDGVAGLAAPLGRGNTNPVDSLVMGSGLTSASVDGHWDDITVTAVPEPATMAALALGAVGMFARRRKKAA
jgi:hypothetical protein